MPDAAAPLLRIALHHGTSWIARAIQWQTRSYWNHASLLFEGEPFLFEALEGRGVLHGRTLGEARARETVQVFRVMGLTAAGAERALAFARAQIGKRYDTTMVLRFISRQQDSRKSSGRWFCSELAFATLQEAGLAPLARCEPWEVSPQLLSLSPLLVADDA